MSKYTVSATIRARGREIKAIKEDMFIELSSLSKGIIERQEEHFLYKFSNGFNTGVGKPGKEFARNDIKYKSGEKKNNPHDMTPLVMQNRNPLNHDPSFSGIFKAFVPLSDDPHALELLGTLIFRNAYLYDHEEVLPRIWRYKPCPDLVAQISKNTPKILGMPVDVFLSYTELIACNEDVKYKTLGYDVAGAYGRRNNLTTYCNLIAVLKNKSIQTEIEFLESFMHFAGRLTAVPTGINGISQKDAFKSFPLLV
jgi:hypothetical protein